MPVGSRIPAAAHHGGIQMIRGLNHPRRGGGSRGRRQGVKPKFKETPEGARSLTDNGSRKDSKDPAACSSRRGRSSTGRGGTKPRPPGSALGGRSRRDTPAPA